MNSEQQPQQQGGHIRVGISACLMGEKVRYNGSHKFNRFAAHELSRYFSFETFCPEMTLGLGVPRQPIRLIQSPDGDRLVDNNDYSADHTAGMVELARAQEQWLGTLNGFIFMQKSPSCGAFRVKTYNPANNIPDGHGQGIFAREVQAMYPWLPVEEAGRLTDARLAENFLIRVFLLAELHEEVFAEPSLSALMNFHSRQKYLLMAHNQQLARELGAELAKVAKASVASFLPRYRTKLMKVLAKPATRGSKINALDHVKGYLKKYLSEEEKRSLNQAIRDYADKLVPFVVPLTLVRHYLTLYYQSDSYIRQQRFLEPLPREFGYSNVN